MFYIGADRAHNTANQHYRVYTLTMMQRVGGGDSSVKTETREMNILCHIRLFVYLFRAVKIEV